MLTSTRGDNHDIIKWRIAAGLDYLSVPPVTVTIGDVAGYSLFI